jgi:DNA-binding FadR family transcriptional regulator
LVAAIREKDAMAAEFAMRNHVHASSQIAMVPDEVQATVTEPYYLH